MESSWSTSANSLEFGDAIHVWNARLHPSPGTVESFEEILAAGERARAARFRFPRDRDRYILSHGLLRTTLARYLHLPAEQLQFVYGPYGKPVLTGSRAAEQLSFSLSHSGDVMVLAVARRVAVGIDVERIQALPDWEQVAARFLSPLEVEELRRAPEPLRNRKFFARWTRHESYLKAIGRGLSRQPAQPETPGAAWWFQDLEPEPGYLATLAASERPAGVRCFHLPLRL